MKPSRSFPHTPKTARNAKPIEREARIALRRGSIEPLEQDVDVGLGGRCFARLKQPPHGNISENLESYSHAKEGNKYALFSEYVSLTI
jgi:hypothetical protein